MNDERGLFPARGNTIAGQVKILKPDGEEQADRSNVVVFLDRVKSETAFPRPRKNPVISQKNRRFTPRVLPVMKGTTVDFPNDDTIFHNVFSLSKTRPFDLDIYPPGKSKSFTFKRTGWVKVYCNIHPQMIVHIIVLDNPFFALTDQKGDFRHFRRAGRGIHAQGVARVRKSGPQGDKGLRRFVLSLRLRDSGGQEVRPA